jgi:hypothetical protein
MDGFHAPVIPGQAARKKPPGQIARQDALSGPRAESRLSLTAMSDQARFSGQVRVLATVGGTLRLLLRRPFSVLAWGLFTTLVGFAPLSLIGLANVPSALAAAQTAALAGEVTASTALLTHLVAAGVLAALLTMLVFAIVGAAVYRAVLEPDNRGLFHMKLGRRELGLVGHYLAQSILWLGLVVAVLVPTAWAIGLIANTAGRGLAVLIALILALGIGYGAVIVGLRLFLGGPITFDRAEFGLVSSWGVTRNRLGPILGVAVVMALLLWLWSDLFYTVAHLTLVSAAAEWAAGPTIERRVELVAILSLYLGVVRVLVAAPPAVICREILPAAGSARS